MKQTTLSNLLYLYLYLIFFNISIMDVNTANNVSCSFCKEGPGWNDPMTAVVPRVKGFACYGLSFSRHNKNIKMEHFFLYILSRYFI